MTAKAAKKAEIGKSAGNRPKTPPDQHAKTAKGKKHAQLIMSPECAAYRVIRCADENTDLHQNTDVQSLVDELRAQSAAVRRGDLEHVEAMLMNQATSLQSLFTGLTQRAMGQTYLSSLESFMRLALKAQSQCRATLETLAAIKNPPVVIARQANINQGSGNQQVNNGTPDPIQPVHIQPPSRAGKIKIQPNELLEVKHGSEELDSRTAGKAGRTNQKMAALEKIDRRTDGRGQGGIVT